MSRPFVHLHLHSEYSLADSTIRIKELVARCADLARIDGNAMPPGLCCPAETWIGGDARDRTIRAASILAKVSRDRHMLALHAQWPDYGFAEHKGYATPAHRAALERHGPCPAHRRSFAPVRDGQLALDLAMAGA